MHIYVYILRFGGVFRPRLISFLGCAWLRRLKVSVYDHEDALMDLTTTVVVPTVGNRGDDDDYEQDTDIDVVLSPSAAFDLEISGKEVFSSEFDGQWSVRIDSNQSSFDMEYSMTHSGR